MNSRPLLPRPQRPPRFHVLPSHGCEGRLWFLILPSHGYRGRLWVPDLLCTAPETKKALPVLSVSVLPVLSVSALPVCWSLVLLCVQVLSGISVQSAPLWWFRAPSVPPGGFRSICSVLGVYSPVGSALVGSSPLCSARRVTVPSARPGGLQVRLLRLGGFSPVCSALVGSSSLSAPPWRASVRSALPWWAPVPILSALSSHGPGPPSLPLFRLRSTAHLVMCRSVWKPLLGGGLCHESKPWTSSGHSPLEVTLTSLDSHTVTDHPSRLHLPSFTAPLTAVSHYLAAPVHNHLITHTLHKPEHSATLCRVLFSLATLQSVSQFS